MKRTDDNRFKLRLQVVVAVEPVALLIGMLLPITPSKTGSDNDIAKYFLENPTYLEKVGVSFLIVNGLITVMAAAYYAYVRWTVRRE